VGSGPSQPRRILFDEAHDEQKSLSWDRALQIEPDHPDWVYFGELEDALADEFILELNPDQPLTTELLQDYEVVVFAAPAQSLTTAERQALKKYVDAGGGLLVLGQCWVPEPFDQLMSTYGVSLDPPCIFAPPESGVPDLNGDFIVDDFTDHAAVQGVESMITNWGSSLAVAGQAVTLAKTDNTIWQDANGNGQFDSGEPTGPFKIVAAYEGDQQRVAAVSGAPFQDSAFEWRRNDILMRALLRWLSRGAPKFQREYIHLPLIIDTT